MKYLITYDLNSPGQNYEALYKAIKSTGDWIHALQNTWFVKSQYTASEIRDQLMKVVDSGDEIFVTEISGWASCNMSKAADWLNDR